MKILLTVHQFVPEYTAGTEVLTFETAKELRSRGHEVRVFTGFPAQKQLRDDQRFDRYEIQGISVERFHHSYTPMAGQQNTTEAEYNNLLVAQYMRRCLMEWRPDVVHFFHLGRISASVVDVCHQLGIPMVLTPTDFWFVCPTNQLRLPDNTMCTGPNPSGVNCVRHIVALNQTPEMRERLERMPDVLLALAIQGMDRGYFAKHSFSAPVTALYRRTGFLRKRINLIDRVLVPTRLMYSILLGNGVDPIRMVLCPYGINVDHITAGPAAPRSQLQLGFIGTLYEHKGAHVLIQALRTLPAGLPIGLKIYGRRDEFPAYVERLEQLAAGDARIRFCGTFPNREIGAVLSELDALVVPSIWYENTPLVIYSAQAAKRPVIASNLGGMAEVVKNDINGLLFEPGDVAGLAGLLQKVCADRSILSRLSRSAVTPKSARQYAADVEKIYRELVPMAQSA